MHYPITKIKGKNKDNFPWLNDSLCSLKAKKDYLFSLLTDYGSKED